MTKAILDSSFLVALIDEKDKWRNTAVLIQKALKKKKARLLYLDCAVNETISVIARRLEEKGRSISETEFSENTVFVLGDHIGLPKTVENFALRYAEKISLGKQPYLAASCITILNYLMDSQSAY